MTPPFRTLGDKPYDSHYQWAEIDIDAPASIVFARARRISEWMNAHAIETIDGVPGETGHFERVFPASIAPGTPEPHYHLYGIAHLIPDRYIGLEVFDENGGSYGRQPGLVSFDGIILTELDANRTRVTFLLIQLHEGRPAAEVADERAEKIERARVTMTLPYLRTLKAQAEGDVAASREDPAGRASSPSHRS